MAETVTMPKLGFDMAEGTLVRWVIGEGEPATKGAVLAEIETDKATVEVESTYEGVLLQHLVKEGDVVPVGTPIAVVGQPGEKVETQQEQAPTTDEVKTAAQLSVPPGAETPREMAEGGPPAPAEGAPGKVQFKPGAEPQPTSPAPDGDGQLPGGVRVSPLARRIAEEKGVDLSAVQGSGPDGRIVKRDVETFLEKGGAAQPAAGQPAAAPAVPAAPAAEKKPAAPAPAFAPVGPPPPDETVPLTRLRQAIGRRMVEAKQQVPHFYVTRAYDMQKVMDLRKQINAMLPENEKISVNDFVIKAVALALRQYPNLNASLQGDKAVRHGAVNIGVAVAVEGGLLTVVCRDADRKSLRQIAQEVRTMAGRAREGKVRPDDIEGSTFSISNLGMYDIDEFIAIINPPEAAILAVGAAREEPVVKDGQIVPGLRMKATISVDHRVSDGAEAAQYMRHLASYLEEPMRLLL